MNRTSIILLIALLFVGSPLGAEVRDVPPEWFKSAANMNFSLDTPQSDGSLGLRMGGIAGVEAEVFFPCFRWAQGPYFDRNFIRFKTSLTTATDILGLAEELTLEPLSFAHIKVGGSVGTGWNFPLAQSTMRGLALNDPFEDKPFGGPVTSGWISLPFDFNLEPNPNLFNQGLGCGLEPQVKYQSFTGSSRDWYWDHDNGKNFTGLSFKVTGYLGLKYKNEWGSGWDLKGSAASGIRYFYFSAGYETLKEGFAKVGKVSLGIKGSLCLNPWNFLSLEPTLFTGASTYFHLPLTYRFEF